jgi:hypothetical protein
MKLHGFFTAVLLSISASAQPMTPSELAWPTVGGQGVPLLPIRTFWLMADAGVYTDLGATLATNNQTVTQWNDQSSTGYNMTNLDAANRAVFLTNQLNGLPMVRFTSGHYVQNLSGTVVQPMAFICVMKFTASPSVINQLTIRDVSNLNGIGRTVAATNLAYITNLTFASITDGYLTNNVSHIIAAVINGASSLLRLDGTTVATGDAGSGSWDRLLIGSDQSYFDLAEVIRYEKVAPSISQIQTDEAYLRAKWGL